MIVSTLPVFMSPGVHYLEAWNEAVCAGAWGRPAAWLGERVRRALDLEHWPAFQASFTRMVSCCAMCHRAPERAPPASVTLVGGDIHNAYVAEVSLGRRDDSPQPRAPARVLAVSQPALAARATDRQA